MEDEILAAQTDRVISKIKHYFITAMGITAGEPSDEEFYRALALTLREEIMINWTATIHTMRSTKCRKLHYLCMEYMPGKFLGNNIANLHADELVRSVVKKMGREYAEICRIEAEPGLGNGGLGRLASCFVDSLATQQYPAIAYGLRYQYGIFEQEIWDGVQVERPDNWLLHDNPWEFRRDFRAQSIYFAGKTVPVVNKKGVETYDLEDYEEVRAIPYDFPIVGFKASREFNVVTLRAWTTKESPRNFKLQRFNAGMIDQAAENTTLTDVLYPNDNNEVGKRVRLKQEFLLASASIQDIIYTHLSYFPDMSQFADKIRIQINDTHPALVIAELLRILIRDHDFSWGEAWETVKTCCSFTNHTVLKESLEEWNQNRLHYLLPRQYHLIEKLNQELCNAVRQKFPGEEERVRRMSIIEAGQVRMANLAIYGSHRVNGVSELHSSILKNEIFKDFSDLYPDRFINVTNGITQRRFLLHTNPSLSKFISWRIGPGWISDLTKLSDLAAYATEGATQQEFLRVKKAGKHALIAYLKERNQLRDATGKVIGCSNCLGPEALFDVQMKRIHEYKRQLMNVLHLIMLYHEIKAEPTSRKIKRMVLFAGKAAPGYEMAKHILRLIFCVAKKINNDPVVNTKLQVAFIENYNVTRAEIILPAIDLSEQISTAGMEASGTGNMKLALNGALTIATDDGANIEMRKAVGDEWWPFLFGKKAAEIEKLKPTYNPWDVYMHNLAIRQAVDALRDKSFAESEEESAALTAIYQSLLEPQNGNVLDKYFVLGDLQSYYETQKKVEEVYLNPERWAAYAIHNIAAMGAFSSDTSIHNYAKLVWDLAPCPVDKKELARVRDEYSEHDKCRILN